MSARKHKYHTLEVGQSYEMANPPSWLKSAVYEYGAGKNKKFSITKVRRGDPWSPIVIRRTA